MKFNYYDIESLTNVFTLANLDENDVAVVYYLLDDMSLMRPTFYEDAKNMIYKKNKNFRGAVELKDLADPKNNFELARLFGLSDAVMINDPNSKSSYDPSYRLVCDTDPDYDENVYPYFGGYNSENYDTTMLTWYFYNSIDAADGNFHKQTAKSMRVFNDELFSSEFKDRMPDRLRYMYKDPARPNQGYTQPNYRLPTVLIRKNMIMSGRHIDVAKLNEKQSKVGLKRVLGGQGYQILESDKLRPGQDTIETYEQLLELIAYNISDIVNLKKLAAHKAYKSNFLLKRQLLKDYPDMIYKEKDNTYKPDIRSESVRPDRLTINSSSAQLATKALCPYGHLQDYDTVSFMYPSEAKAKALGIPRVNVLEESRKFFYDNFKQPDLRKRFDDIYNYYKSIEGKNFNASKNYLKDHNVDPDSYNPEDLLPPELKPMDIVKIPVPNTCLFYYDRYGHASSCFVNFSIGGIHGAEYNKRLYQSDMVKYQEKIDDWTKTVNLFSKVRQIYPDPTELKRNKGVVINGVKYTPSTFLRPKATVDEAYYKDPPEPPKAPVLFKESKTQSGGITWSLEKRYAYTSAAMTNHEDFTSYYPNMLRMMDAFYNPGLGYDRYGEIFDNKTKFGILKDDKTLDEATRDQYSVMREGTKLVLNSASGAADATFESNIRMNNKIISMRIIGQLFTWRIGQAQTIAGASMISTNTDGLYSVLEAEYNNTILKRESASINVEIEPEPIFLISKDTNNRAEIKVKDNQLADVVSTSGGTLACRKGPNPMKSLSHPAIIDWALTEYLIIASVKYKDLSLEKPFDNEIGMSIIKAAREIFNDDVHMLTMFQNIIASSPGSQRFVFALPAGRLDADPIPLQHYNRAFIVKDGTPGTYHLKTAAAKVITDVQIKKRIKANERPQQHDPAAAAILAVNGIKTANLPTNKEAAVVKITNVEENWYMLIENSDLHMMTKDEIEKIFNSLDYDKYLSLLRDTFESSWRNLTPEWEEAEKAKKTKKKEPVSLFSDDVTEIMEQTQTDKQNLLKPDTQPADKQSLPETAEPECDAPKDMSEIDIPKMIQLNKTLLSTTDIYNGEHQLCMHGIREIDAHTVLAKLLKVMTDTNIDE